MMLLLDMVSKINCYGRKLLTVVFGLTAVGGTELHSGKVIPLRAESTYTPVSVFRHGRKVLADMF